MLYDPQLLFSDAAKTFLSLQTVQQHLVARTYDTIISRHCRPPPQKNQTFELITIIVLHNVRTRSPAASQKAVIFTAISCELCISHFSDYYLTK